MKAAILGKKLGMTSLYTDKGEQVPCTIVLAGPCPVIMKRTSEIDGYKSIQVGFGEIEDRKVNKPIKGHFKKSGVQPTKWLKEFRGLESEFEIGTELTVEQFTIGDKVKIIGTSIGRGFQGVVKRHHFGGVGLVTHGQSDRVRAPGSIGSSSYPSRVIKGLRMAGRMGGKQNSIRNLQVIDILKEQNLLIIKGSIPGHKNSLIEIIKL